MGRLDKFKAVLPDIGLSVLAGLLLLLSTPGFDIWPLAFAGFAVLIWVFERKKVKAYKAAFIVGLIFYTVGISWVHVPMTFFGGAPMWAGVLLVLLTGIVGGLLFWAPYGFVVGRTGSHILGGLLFIALEMLKGKYFVGGLPWLNMGQTQYNNLPALQLVSVVGEHGLSLVVILTAVYLYRVAALRSTRDVSILAALLVFIFGYGSIRLAIYNKPVEAYTARIVQTGIDQADKWVSEKRREVYDTLRSRVLEAAFAPGEYDLMVLPETSFTVNPFTNADIHGVVRRISVTRPVIISFDRRLTEGEQVKLYNTTALVFDGVAEQNYNKMKLAPFGEYFPFEKQLYPIRKFFFGDGMLFSPGNNPALFEFRGLKIIPLICFESAFSEIVRERVKLGGNVIFIVSNDSWFGESRGRVQNFAINIVRAVEYDRYVVRATQDGISGLITPYGTVEERLPEKEFAFRDVGFAPLDKVSFFAKFGYTWYVIFLMAYAVFLLKKRRKNG